jgi:hypothetical protein
MEISVDDSRLKKLKKNLDEMKDLKGGKNVPITELLTPEFMNKHTKVQNFEEFVLKSSFINPDEQLTPEVFKSIPDKEWDEYISNETSFSSWDDMIGTAGKEYTVKRLFKGL